KSLRGDIVKEFDEYTTKLVEDSWSDFFLTAAKSGFELIGLSEGSARRKHNVPPVALDGEQVVLGQRAITLMSGTPGGVFENQRQIAEVLDKLHSSQDAVHQYVKTLCYALLFAHAERWSVAKLIARRAIQIQKNFRTREDADSAKSPFFTARE